MVVPRWGFYAIMIAQLMSQISSHIVIHYHRQSVELAKRTRLQTLEKDVGNKAVVATVLEGTEEEDDGNDDCTVTSSRHSSELDTSTEALHSTKERSSLSKHEYNQSYRGEDEALIVRNGINPALCIVAACLMLLVVLGCFIPSFSSNIYGLFGIVVASGQEETTVTTGNYYSMFKVVTTLLEQARTLDRFADYVGLGALSVILLSFVLIVPLILAVALLWQWFQPMTITQRSQWVVILEILQAWQCPGLYGIAVVLAQWYV